MRTFVQLKDGVAFAYVDTDGEAPGIEVEFGTGESYIKKQYKDGSWSDAELIVFAEVSESGSILEVKRTYFSSEVGGNPMVEPGLDLTSKWVDGEWRIV